MIHERYEDWDFFPSKGESSYGYSGSLLRLMFSQKAQSYDWAVELAAPILLGIPNHAVQPAPQGQLGLGGSYYAANDGKQNAASRLRQAGLPAPEGRALERPSSAGSNSPTAAKSHPKIPRWRSSSATASRSA